MIKTDTFKRRVLGSFSVVSRKLSNPKGKAIALVALFAVIGVIALVFTHAATIATSLEAESGALDTLGCADKVVDASASAGNYVKFGCGTTVSNGPGAHLPITYNPNTLTGTVRYVSINGSDSAAGTSAAPNATLAKAVSSSAANDTIVVGGGLYRGQRNIGGKTGLHITAASNEIPEFRGSESVPSANSGGSGNGWTASGNLSYRSYLRRPEGNGGGVCFFIISASDCPNSQNVNINATSGANGITGYVGKYADQVWIGNTALQQVVNQADLQDGRFWVDMTNNRLYLTAVDAAKQQIETSRQNTTGDRDRLFDVSSANMTIEGLSITRYSPNANDYGVITVGSAASNFKLKNISVSYLPYDGIDVAAGNTNTTFQNISIDRASWQSINSNQTDNFMLDSVKITNTDPFKEFSSSPASGALKTSRNRGTIVKNSAIANNNSHGLWFDQSNINTTVANNTITDNENAGVFFEISDGLTLVNNFLKGGGQPFKATSSGGVVAVNNTFVSGADPFGIYTDDRARAGCSTATSPACQTPSDVQTRYPRPVTMDWFPRVDLMLNNIIAYPTGTVGGCSSSFTSFCISTSHPVQNTSRPIETIIHKADATLGIPQTIIDGNVYTSTTGILVTVSAPNSKYTTLAAWTAAMAGSPVGITGIDANSKAGASWVNADGSPTAALAAVHGQAIAVPTNNAINPYIPAGTKHYGVLSK